MPYLELVSNLSVSSDLHAYILEVYPLETEDFLYYFLQKIVSLLS